VSQTQLSSNSGARLCRFALRRTAPFCVLLRTKIPFFLTEEKTVFERLMLFCPKMVRLSQQNGKETGLFFGMRAEKGVSLHQKSFFIRNIYHLVGF
jgi:hypothetical protein